MNNQQVDKVITFYRINHGFHDPYKFLLDGNFLTLLVQKEVDLRRRLHNLLTARIVISITKCILHELGILGEAYKLVLAKANQCTLIHCGHELGYSVDKCIAEQVGDHNPRMIIVCTQDIELRRYLRNVENAPLMYVGPDQRVTMEDVHKKNLKALEFQSKKKYLPNQNELPLLADYKQEKKRLQKQQKQKELQRLASIKGISPSNLKTKIVKGPNPLSIKKKKIKPVDEPLTTGQKKKRIRKRNKNKKTVVSNTNDTV